MMSFLEPDDDLMSDNPGTIGASTGQEMEKRFQDFGQIAAELGALTSLQPV